MAVPKNVSIFLVTPEKISVPIGIQMKGRARTEEYFSFEKNVMFAVERLLLREETPGSPNPHPGAGEGVPTPPQRDLRSLDNATIEESYDRSKQRTFLEHRYNRK